MEFITAKEIIEEEWRNYFNALIKIWGERNAFLSYGKRCMVREQLTNSNITVPKSIMDELKDKGWIVDVYNRIDADTGFERTILVLNAKPFEL
ncbi:MAG: hypothetical protein EGQ04_01995 [Ruminococcaceae bacterium]|nr:hypothetical protein [uncultured Ruminococcus sp.]MBD9120856.1 hypothetical protein [Oscillospiraceae bacterium]